MLSHFPFMESLILKKKLKIIRFCSKIFIFSVCWNYCILKYFEQMNSLWFNGIRMIIRRTIFFCVSSDCFFLSYHEKSFWASIFWQLILFFFLRAQILLERKSFCFWWYQSLSYFPCYQSKFSFYILRFCWLLIFWICFVVVKRLYHIFDDCKWFITCLTSPSETECFPILEQV
jgi:hypothetical protein